MGWAGREVQVAGHQRVVLAQQQRVEQAAQASGAQRRHEAGQAGGQARDVAAVAEGQAGEVELDVSDQHQGMHQLLVDGVEHQLDGARDQLGLADAGARPPQAQQGPQASHGLDEELVAAVLVDVHDLEVAQRAVHPDPGFEPDAGDAALVLHEVPQQGVGIALLDGPRPLRNAAQTRSGADQALGDPVDGLLGVDEQLDAPLGRELPAHSARGVELGAQLAQVAVHLLELRPQGRLRTQLGGDVLAEPHRVQARRRTAQHATQEGQVLGGHEAVGEAAGLDAELDADQWVEEQVGGEALGLPVRGRRVALAQARGQCTDGLAAGEGELQQLAQLAQLAGHPGRVIEQVRNADHRASARGLYHRSPPTARAAGAASTEGP